MTEINLEGIRGKDRDQIEAELNEILDIFLKDQTKLIRRFVVPKNFNDAMKR